MKKEQTVLEETTEEVETLQEVTKEVRACNFCEATEDVREIQEFKSHGYKIDLCGKCIDQLNAEGRTGLNYLDDMREEIKRDQKKYVEKEISEVIEWSEEMSFALLSMTGIFSVIVLFAVSQGVPFLIGVSLFLSCLIGMRVLIHAAVEHMRDQMLDR